MCFLNFYTKLYFLFINFWKTFLAFNEAVYLFTHNFGIQFKELFFSSVSKNWQPTTSAT